MNIPSDAKFAQKLACPFCTCGVGEARQPRLSRGLPTVVRRSTGATSLSGAVAASVYALAGAGLFGLYSGARPQAFEPEAERAAAHAEVRTAIAQQVLCDPCVCEDCPSLEPVEAPIAWRWIIAAFLLGLVLGGAAVACLALCIGFSVSFWRRQVPVQEFGRGRLAIRGEPLRIA